MRWLQKSDIRFSKEVWHVWKKPSFAYGMGRFCFLALGRSVCTIYLFPGLSDFPSYSFPRTRMQWHTTWYNVVPDMIQCSAWNRIVIYNIRYLYPFLFHSLSTFPKTFIIFSNYSFQSLVGIYFCITFALAFAFFVRLRIEIVLWKIYIERDR